MAETVYTLLQKGDSDEYHLFEGAWLDPKHEQCSVGLKSVCKKMDKGERAKGVDGKVKSAPFACQSEQVARERIAKRGRSVCGICVSSLYRTED